MTERETLFDRIQFISALEVPEDAIIVVKSSIRITVETAERVKEAVSETFPGRKVLVLPPSLEIDVLRETAE